MNVRCLVERLDNVGRERNEYGHPGFLHVEEELAVLQPFSPQRRRVADAQTRVAEEQRHRAEPVAVAFAVDALQWKAVAGRDDRVHLGGGERERRILLHFRRVEGLHRVLRHPLHAHAEVEEADDALVLLRRRERLILPGRAPGGEAGRGELFQVAQSLVVRPYKELLLEDGGEFRDRRLCEVPRAGVVEVLRDGVIDARRLLLHRTDRARGVPLRDEVRCGFDGSDVHRAADGLSAERALDPDRAGAAPVGTGGMGTGLEVTAVDRKHRTLRSKSKSTY